MLKRFLLASVVTAATAGAAVAAPITGSFSLTSFGGYYVIGSTTTSFTTAGATSDTATGLDFGAAFGSAGNGFGTNGSALVGNSMGSFVGLDGTLASVSDILLGSTANPYQSNPFISFGSSSAISVNFSNAQITRNANGVRVFGTASFTDGNAADTSVGTFNITTSTQNNNNSQTVNFTFTGNSGATSVPEPISLALLGTSLVGLGLARSKRRG